MHAATLTPNQLFDHEIGLEQSVSEKSAPHNLAASRYIPSFGRVKKHFAGI